MSLRSDTRGRKKRGRKRWWLVRPRYNWPYFWCVFCGLLIHRGDSAVYLRADGVMIESFDRRDARRKRSMGYRRLDNTGAHALRKCWKVDDDGARDRAG